MTDDYGLFGNGNTGTFTPEVKADVEDVATEDLSVAEDAATEEKVTDAPASDDAAAFVAGALDAAKTLVVDAEKSERISGRTIQVNLRTFKKVKVAEINNTGTGITAHDLVSAAVIEAVKVGDLPTQKRKKSKDTTDSHNLTVRAPEWWWRSLGILITAMGDGWSYADIIEHAVKEHMPKSMG